MDFPETRPGAFEKDAEPGAPSEAFLIVGLGNPGSRYRETRHNAGFWVIDRVCRQLGDLKLSQGDRTVAWGTAYHEEAEIHLAKPLTYMNRSGAAVRKLVDRLGTDRRRLLIVYDDMALPLGMIRLRGKGSSGGHRGMESIIEALGTEGFPRLRIGIGPPGDEAVDHVLSPMSQAEREVMEAVLDRAEDAVWTFVHRGLTAAMDRHNRRARDEEEE